MVKSKIEIIVDIAAEHVGASSRFHLVFPSRKESIHTGFDPRENISGTILFLKVKNIIQRVF